jgi:hypothetical protein
MERTTRWFARSLFALAAGLVVVAALGPAGLGVIEYRYTETMRNQARGFAALVVAPVAVTAGLLARRRQPAAPLLALGPAAFATYMLTQYVIGPEYLTVSGNGERFFLLFVALFVLAGAVLAQAWTATVAPAGADDPAVDRRRGRLVLGLAVLVAGGMYLANGFLDAMADFPRFVGERAGHSELDEHPTAYWLVATLDLAVVVPVTVATGIGLLRHRARARRAFYGVVGWFALVPGSVAAMAVTMVVREDPAADPGRAVVFCVVAAACSAAAVRLYAPLVRQGSRSPSAASHSAVRRARTVSATSPRTSS